MIRFEKGSVLWIQSSDCNQHRTLGLSVQRYDPVVQPVSGNIYSVVCFFTVVLPRSRIIFLQHIQGLLVGLDFPQRGRLSESDPSWDYKDVPGTPLRDGLPAWISLSPLVAGLRHFELTRVGRWLMRQLKVVPAMLWRCWDLDEVVCRFIWL